MVESISKLNSHGWIATGVMTQQQGQRQAQADQLSLLNWNAARSRKVQLFRFLFTSLCCLFTSWNIIPTHCPNGSNTSNRYHCGQKLLQWRLLSPWCIECRPWRLKTCDFPRLKHCDNAAWVWISWSWCEISISVMLLFFLWQSLCSKCANQPWEATHPTTK